MLRRLIAGLACAAGLGAQDPAIVRGFSHFYNLEYDEAQAEFTHAAALNPSSPDYHNYIAEAVLFREMFRNGALESELVSGNNAFLRRPRMNPSPETEKLFLGELEASMSLCRQRLAKDPKDTGALYALGIAYGLRANYYWLVRKAWRDSLRDATAGRKLHNRITGIEPGNVDARLTQGLHDYIVGSLPLLYRMAGFLVGIHGDKEKGIRTVEDVARNGRLNRVDAEIFLCALYRRENQPRKALPLLADLLSRYPRNYLLRFEQAQMYSMMGDKQNALHSVIAVRRLKERGIAGYTRVPWDQIWFHLGTIQFWYNDLGDALENMRKVTAMPGQELDLNTGVSAWLRQGQIYDLTNRREQALEAYRNAITFAPQAEAARESRRYLSSPYRR